MKFKFKLMKYKKIRMKDKFFFFKKRWKPAHMNSEVANNGDILDMAGLQM